MNFHTRVTQLPWVAVAKADDNTPILAVNNQLLIDASVAGTVVPLLKNKFKIEALLLTTLLDGLHPLNPKILTDVNIYELVPEPGSEFKPFGGDPAVDGIFWLTDALRNELSEIAHGVAAVSPNHILIPAPYDDSCPFGAPSPIDGPQGFAAQPGLPQPVTVIDSGWQWDQDNWGPNPLPPRVRAIEAQRLPTLAEAGQFGRHWRQGDPEVSGAQVEVEGQERLLALAGHSNFISGVVFEYCPRAAVTVVNHNGTFLENTARPSLNPKPTLDPNCYDFPTEAAVARSLCWILSENAIALGVAPPKVIDTGFAFLPWSAGITEPGFASANDQISSIWTRTFEYIAFALGHLGRLKEDLMVAAPAGNQGSQLRRYPAALWAKDHAVFERVIGVASVEGKTPGGVPLPSLYSNRGNSAQGDSWVRCAAPGSNVVSAFLKVNAALEDAKDGTVHDFTGNSWAVWNGTSFATPKVAGRIANEIANGAPDALTAWLSVAATCVPGLPSPPGNPDLGFV